MPRGERRPPSPRAALRVQDSLLLQLRQSVVALHQTHHQQLGPSILSPHLALQRPLRVLPESAQHGPRLLLPCSRGLGLPSISLPILFFGGLRPRHHRLPQCFVQAHRVRAHGLPGPRSQCLLGLVSILGSCELLCSHHLLEKAHGVFRPRAFLISKGSTPRYGVV